MHARVKKAELARTLGVSRQAVQDLVRRGVLSEDKDGLIDLELAKVALANRVRPSAKTAQALDATPAATPSLAPTGASGADADTSGAPVSYHVAKAMREAAEARIAQLKLAELRGELIRVEAVRAGLASIFASTRDRLMQLPARLAPVLAAQTDQGTVHDIVRDEIHAALSQLAGAGQQIGVETVGPA